MSETSVMSALFLALKVGSLLHEPTPTNPERTQIQTIISQAWPRLAFPLFLSSPYQTLTQTHMLVPPPVTAPSRLL